MGPDDRLAVYRAWVKAESSSKGIEVVSGILRLSLASSDSVLLAILVGTFKYGFPSLIVGSLECISVFRKKSLFHNKHYLILLETDKMRAFSIELISAGGNWDHTLTLEVYK